MPKPGLALGVLALTTASALAQTDRPAPPAREPAAAAGTAGRGGSGTGHAGRHARDLRAQRAAGITLAQAVEAAENRGQGRAVEAKFETRDGAGAGAGAYGIKVLNGDGKLVEHRVDGGSGQVTESEDQPVEGFFSRLRPADVRDARTTLRQAIAIAERSAGGRAAEAEAERGGDAVRYKVTVADGGRTREVKVDADGQAVVRD